MMKKYKVKPIINSRRLLIIDGCNIKYQIYQRFLYIFYINCNGKQYTSIEEAVEVCEKLNKLS